MLFSRFLRSLWSRWFSTQRFQRPRRTARTTGRYIELPTAYKKDILNTAKRAKTRSNSGLQTHRRRQHDIVFKRADYACEICKWSVGQDLHHVYGRGRNKNDWREQEDALLCTCRTCHPLPIQNPGFPSDRGGEKAEEALVRLFGPGIIEKHQESYRSVK